jgi:hypothetical protein
VCMIRQALKFAMACSAAQLILLTCLLNFSRQSRNLIECILTGLLPRSGRSEATSHSPAYGGTDTNIPLLPLTGLYAGSAWRATLKLPVFLAGTDLLKIGRSERNRPGLMVPYGREDASWHLRAEDLSKY